MNDEFIYGSGTCYFVEYLNNKNYLSWDFIVNLEDKLIIQSTKALL